MTARQLLPEMIRGSLRPMMDVLRSKGQYDPHESWLVLVDACELIGAVADALRSTGKRLLHVGVEGSAAIALSRERIRAADELVNCCAEISSFFAEGELAEEDRETLAGAVKGAVGRARKAREFYANLTAWIEQGRNRPVPPLDELRRDDARRLTSNEALQELKAQAGELQPSE